MALSVRPTVVTPRCRPSWVDLGGASVLDAEFLAEQLGLLLELVVVAGEPNTNIDAIGGPAAGGYDSIVCQRDDVQKGRLDVLGPSGRQRDVWQGVIGHRHASWISLAFIS